MTARRIMSFYDKPSPMSPAAKPTWVSPTGTTCLIWKARLLEHWGWLKMNSTTYHMGRGLASLGCILSSNSQPWYLGSAHSARMKSVRILSACWLMHWDLPEHCFCLMHWCRPALILTTATLTQLYVVSFLVFKGLVRSGYWVLWDPNQDRDWLGFIPGPKIT